MIFVSEASENAAAEIAEGLRGRLEAGRWIGRKLHCKVTASFGVAELEEHRHSLDAAIDGADRALYQAKRSGRNQVALASSIPKRGSKLLTGVYGKPESLQPDMVAR